MNNVETLLALAATFPPEVLADRLLEDAKEYLMEPSDETEAALTMSAHIWMMHKISGGTPEGIADMIKDVESSRQKLKLFETDKN